VLPLLTTSEVERFRLGVASLGERRAMLVARPLQLELVGRGASRQESPTSEAQLDLEPLARCGRGFLLGPAACPRCSAIGQRRCALHLRLATQLDAEASYHAPGVG
jgi:hypothetical protein